MSKEFLTGFSSKSYPKRSDHMPSSSDSSSSAKSFHGEAMEHMSRSTMKTKLPESNDMKGVGAFKQVPSVRPTSMRERGPVSSEAAEHPETKTGRLATPKQNNSPKMKY